MIFKTFATWHSLPAGGVPCWPSAALSAARGAGMLEGSPRAPQHPPKALLVLAPLLLAAAPGPAAVALTTAAGPAGPAPQQAAAGSVVTVADRAWLWTHPTGFHDNYFTHAPFTAAAPGTYRSRITPTEAALYLGLRSALFVYEQQAGYTLCQRGDNTTGAYPCYPTTQAELPKYMLPFESTYFQQTAFSISGGGVSYPENYTDAVIAAMPNSSVGVIFDDFAFDECHLELLQNMSRRMDDLGGKDVFLVVYAFELAAMGPAGLKPFLAAATRPMLWFKNRTELADLEEHWAAFEAAIAHAGGRPKKPMLGMYMFDYLTHHAAGAQEMPAALMAAQLSAALRLLHAGRVHDVIFLGSPIVDLPLATVEQTRAWLAEHGREPIAPLRPLPPPVAAVAARKAPRLQSSPRISVYEAGEGHYTQFRIPVLISLPSVPATPASGCVAGPGVLLAFAEGRGRNHTSAADWGNVHIVVRKSIDGGVTWGELVVVADNTWDGAKAVENTWVGNPSPVYDKATGRITVVFTFMNREVHTTVSTDVGDVRTLHVTNGSFRVALIANRSKCCVVLVDLGCADEYYGECEASRVEPTEWFILHRSWRCCRIAAWRGTGTDGGSLPDTDRQHVVSLQQQDAMGSRNDEHRSHQRRRRRPLAIGWFHPSWRTRLPHGQSHHA